VNVVEIIGWLAIFLVVGGFICAILYWAVMFLFVREFMRQARGYPEPPGRPRRTK